MNLRDRIRSLAAEEGESEIEIVSQLLAVAAVIGNESAVEELRALKWSLLFEQRPDLAGEA